MPNLKDIRRRIGSVEKTQQITRAMRMVAGAKLRRAQDAILAARPYADRMQATLAEIARVQKEIEHPLFEVRDAVRRVEFVVVTSDRGLCGAFNSNVLKHAGPLVNQRADAGTAVTITTAGKKARDFFRRRRPDDLGADHPQHGWVHYGQAVEIASRLCERYTAGEVDEVVLIYSEFVTAMNQRPREVRLLPFAAAAAADDKALPYEIEPDADALLRVIAPRAVEVEIFRALLENQAGEHAARMAAMESATRNTEDMISRLRLQYNRARQAAITKELVEIVSGAEAL